LEYVVVEEGRENVGKGSDSKKRQWEAWRE
jgi:hypothetical protein